MRIEQLERELDECKKERKTQETCWVIKNSALQLEIDKLKERLGEAE
jgi:regulator of replication initiation timing